jgi:tetratricopeptide (TPR) repeat protein
MTKNTNANSSIKTAAGTIGLLLVALFFIEIQYSLASQNGRSSDRYLSLWDKQGKPPSKQQWQQALSQAQQANQLNSNNPDNLYRLGLLYEWRGRMDTVDDSPRQDIIRTAKSYYKKVLDLRSTRGWDWYRLFKTKTKLNEIDDEAEAAITTAMYVDPNNHGLKLFLIYYGLSNPQNSTITQSVDESTRHLLKNAPSKHYTLYKHYKSYRQQAQLCQLAQQLNITSKGLAKCNEQ